MQTHTGPVLDARESRALKKAAQTPLSSLLGSELLLTRAILRLRRAVDSLQKSESARSGEEEAAADDEEFSALLVRRLRDCAHSPPPQRGAVEAGAELLEDRFLSYLNEALSRVQKPLLRLARASRRLLFEYAAFAVWLGDANSFLPVKPALGTSTENAAKSASQTGHGQLTSFLPSVLAVSEASKGLSKSEQQASPTREGLDLFGCLWGFLEKLHAFADSAEGSFSQQRKRPVRPRRRCLRGRLPRGRRRSSLSPGSWA